MQKIIEQVVEKVRKDFDLWVATLMGLVSVSTAFFVFCAAMWGSTAVANYSKANTQLNEANTTYLEYNNAFIQDGLRELRLISGGLTEAAAEIETEAANLEIQELLDEYNELADKSEEHLQTADMANSEGDKFQLIAVLLATTLFLASMSLSAKKENTKMIFFFLAAGFFLLILLSSVILKFPF